MWRENKAWRQMLFRRKMSLVTSRDKCKTSCENTTGKSKNRPDTGAEQLQPHSLSDTAPVTELCSGSAGCRQQHGAAQTCSAVARILWTVKFVSSRNPQGRSSQLLAEKKLFSYEMELCRMQNMKACFRVRNSQSKKCLLDISIKHL